MWNEDSGTSYTPDKVRRVPTKKTEGFVYARYAPLDPYTYIGKVEWDTTTDYPKEENEYNV